MNKQIVSFYVAFFLLSSFAQVFGKSSYEKVAEKKLFNGEKVYEYKLKNGLRVLFVPRHEAKVLSYQVWFDVGSNDEKLDPKLNKTGLAHLFEHLMFRGSQKYPDGKFEELTSRLGGDKENATTYYYRTNYFEDIPSYQLEKMMEMESDRMKSLNLTLDVVTKEKGAVVGELRRSLDSPGHFAGDELMTLMFEKAPYRFTVLGSEAEIKGFSLEEAQYYYHTYYAPNNATIIVVGDTTEDKLLSLVEKYYGDMKPQVIPKAEMPVEPPQKAERKVDLTHPQATSELLLIGYRIPDVNSPDTAPLSLLGTHLSTGMESRLRKALIDTGVAVSANAGTSNSPDVFEISVNLTEKHKAEDALKIVDREIALLKSKKIGKDSLERSLNQELLGLYNGITDDQSLGNMFGEYLMNSGNYLKGFEIIESYKKLSETDLQNAAKTYLNKNSRSVVIVRPMKKG